MMITRQASACRVVIYCVFDKLIVAYIKTGNNAIGVFFMSGKSVINSKSEVIGVYFPDTVRNALSDNKDVVMYGTKDEYLPLINMFDFRKGTELTLLSTETASRNITTYNANTSSRALDRATIRERRIDVTKSDITLSNPKILLNLTNQVISSLDYSGIPRTYLPIEQSNLAQFSGSFLIIELITINTPIEQFQEADTHNYLLDLAEDARGKRSPRKRTLGICYEKAAESFIKKTSEGPVGYLSNIKVVLLTVVNSTELKEKYLYIDGMGIAVRQGAISSKKVIQELGEAIDLSSNGTEPEGYSMSCCFNDPYNECTDRYFVSLGEVSRVPRVDLHNRPIGLHYTTKNKGERVDSVYVPLDEVDNLPFIFKTKEEALASADVNLQLEAIKEANRRELEELAIQRARENRDHEAALLELRRRHEIELHELGTRKENLKLNSDIRRERSKDLFEGRSYRRKDEYENQKFQRDTWIDTGKTVLAVTGVILAGLTMAGKFK